MTTGNKLPVRPRKNALPDVPDSTYNAPLGSTRQYVANFLRQNNRTGMIENDPFIDTAQLMREWVRDFDQCPFCIPAVHNLSTLKLHPA